MIKLFIIVSVYFALAVSGALFVVWATDYYEQAEYEADHPRLPTQDNSRTEDAFFLTNAPVEMNTRFVLKTQDNDKNIVFVVKSTDNFDYTNSTIEINMSYIKQVRQENNTMIISIRKD